MSVKAQPKLTDKIPQFVKGDYFVFNKELYNVIDIVEQHCLIENCRVETVAWLDLEFVSQEGKKVEAVIT